MKNDKNTDIGNIPISAESPQSIADEMKAQLAALDAEMGTRVSETTGVRRKREEKPEASKPIWTAKGIGYVVVALHDTAFRAMDVAELEDEEGKQVAEQSARFLNEAWPEGAAFEPHAAFVLTEIQVLAPRLAAYQLKKKQEQDRQKAELAARVEQEKLSRGPTT